MPRRWEKTPNYTGKVKEISTGKPIAGATVVVRCSILKPNNEKTILQETRHTTDADGDYTFTIPPLSRSFAAPSRISSSKSNIPTTPTRAGFGDARLSSARQEAKGSAAVLHEHFLLRRPNRSSAESRRPTGCRPNGGDPGLFRGQARCSRVRWIPARSPRPRRTKMSLVSASLITTPGLGVFWIMPKDYAPDMHEISAGEARGELGTFHLKKGMTLKGQAFDIQGKPLVGLIVEIRHDRHSSPDQQPPGLLP